MDFALLGDHADGVEMAAALSATGRHRLIVYSGPPGGTDVLKTRGLECRSVADLEEVLADPAVAAVIVAGKLSARAAQLRRALQSERHVLCVYPPDLSPDAAYEAALIQADTRHVLLPLLPDALHPAIVRLAEWLRTQRFGCLQLERALVGPLFTETARKRHGPAFRDWAVLRALGGEVGEVSAFASGEEVIADEPLLLSGRFERGGLFQASIIPQQRTPRWRLEVLGAAQPAELSFPGGGSGPARFTYSTPEGERREESWEPWEPWPELVRVFETAVEAHPRPVRSRVSWQDCVRALELDDAARRSVERRRASTLEYQEVSEAVGFKGTMTLVGCAMLWGLIVLVIFGAWYRPALWAIPALLCGFLVMQLLRWLLPAAPATPGQGADDSAALRE
ncbi:hypothetical protein AYO40_04280 [Planctomycetaceae bacterium SCGC AG-212-D15]|nr:hypothetical protein AYO40_04280 [Planctomycetaceae bacterium SCGC AG-212-D15]